MKRAKLDCPLTPIADGAALHRVPLDEAGQRGLDERFAVVAGVGEDVLVLDDVEVVDADAVAVADELDGFEGAVADVDAPGESGVGHGVTPRVGRDVARACSVCGTRQLKQSVAGASGGVRVRQTVPVSVNRPHGCSSIRVSFHGCASSRCIVACSTAICVA